MKQNKSILFLVRLYHPHIGGVETHVQRITEIILKKGYKVTIFTEQYNQSLKKSEHYKGVRIIRIPVGRNVFLKKFFIWKWMLVNRRLLEDYDVIHVHDVYYWLYPLLYKALFRKVFITFHGYEDFPIKKTWIIQRKIAEILTRGSICVGEFMKKWYFAKPTYVIYGGVRLVNNIKIKKEQKAVFFGRLDNQTGIVEYIKAYNIIKKKYPNFLLTVVGEGPLEKIIPKDVELIGFQKNVEDYIRNSRFVFVSRFLSMLEALVQKREVIATYDNPVKKDYLKMSPFRKYVQIANNEQKIASFVMSSLSNKSESEKIDDGYEWAKKQSWDNIVKTYLDLWEKS